MTKILLSLFFASKVFAAGFSGFQSAYNNITVNGITTSGTITVNNNEIFANGKGLDFSATASSTSGTTTAKVFTRAAYGTCTPTIYGGTSAGAGTYSVQTCDWTLNQDRVTVFMGMQWSAHTGTGSFRITGFPFAASNANANNVYPCELGIWENITLSASNVPLVYMNPGTNTAQMRQIPSGGGAMGNLDIDTAASLYITCTYKIL